VVALQGSWRSSAADFNNTPSFATLPASLNAMEHPKSSRLCLNTEGKQVPGTTVLESSQSVGPQAASCSSCKEQLELLHAIHDQIASQSPPLLFFWNAVLQTVGVTIGFLFGLYAIFSYHASTIANNTAKQANQLTILSICLTSNAVSNLI
jgi:hypothetical protein